jgi:beta-carotene 3-hydroxylase
MRLLELSTVAVLSFISMEAISYATHRWVMHGAGMRWHRSHHSGATTGWEKNDLFPLVFSVVGFAMFLSAATTHVDALFWAGGGVAAYGATYLFVHEIYIHRRLPIEVPQNRYLEWLRQSHRIHHLFGGEPFGMLFPIVSRSLRVRAERRDSIRVMRSRL